MARNVKAPLAACLVCVAGLVLLTLFALGLEAGRQLDARLFLRLLENPRAEAGGGAEAIAGLGDPLPMLVMLAFACGVALVRRRPGDAVAALVVVAGANVTTQLLKVLLAHPRVKTAIGGDPFEPNTFPSGHTTAVASIAVAYAFVVPAALRSLALILGVGFALAVGSSVVVIGWHYPSDVAGALLIVAAWGFAILAAMQALAPGGQRGAGVSSRAPLPTP